MNGGGVEEATIQGLRPGLNVCVDHNIQNLSMPKVIQEFARYLAITREAEAWGVVVRAGGRIVNEPGEAYPPAGHPADHAFAWARGRVLGGWQLVVITAGEGEFDDSRGEAEPRRVDAGDVLWLAPGRWHRYRPTTAAGWTEHWIELGGDVLKRLVEAGFLPDACQVLRPVLWDALIEAVAALHLALQGRGGRDQPAELAVLGLRVLGLLTARAPHEGSRLERAVRRAERVLAERLGEAPSMPELARELGVNYAGFRREFRRRTGLAPRQYLLKLRLEQAQRMIGATPYTLEAVAEQLGFSSAFHLSAAFKSHYGVSPAAWRRGTYV
jgi:AraC-like DNA-binding protein